MSIWVALSIGDDKTQGVLHAEEKEGITRRTKRLQVRTPVISKKVESATGLCTITLMCKLTLEQISALDQIRGLGGPTIGKKEQPQKPARPKPQARAGHDKTTKAKGAKR